MVAMLKPGVGPLEYGKRRWLQALFAFIILVLYTPIFMLIAYSFNTDKRGVVWRGFTWTNYSKAWNNRDLFDAMINSITIAFISTIIATIIGSMIAVLLWRFKFPFKAGYEGAMALPIVIPEICMGVALLIVFRRDRHAEWNDGDALAAELAHDHYCACCFLLSFCNRGRAFTPCRLQSSAGRGI